MQLTHASPRIQSPCGDADNQTDSYG
jgi:hypothetical protein